MRLERTLLLSSLIFAGCQDQLAPPPEAPDLPQRPAVPPASVDPVAEPEAPEIDGFVHQPPQFGLALRSAAIKLAGRLPTLDEMRAANAPTTYAAQIEQYLQAPSFEAQVTDYFRDMMKLGGSVGVYIGMDLHIIDLDVAPRFAARLAVEDRPLTELFTANLPPAGVENESAEDAALDAAGILTDQGAMLLNDSNMAFRRVRWVQETFACSKFPAEYAAQPEQIGGALYLSPWPFDSISGGPDPTLAPVNFLDTQANVCANCHSTMNHMAPLFARFDYAGVIHPDIQVRTPGPDNAITKLTDWIPAGENYAWRYGASVSHLAGLGRVIASDPQVMSCQVTRAWNWAMSLPDPIDPGALKMPPEILEPLRQSFAAGNYALRPLLMTIFNHEYYLAYPEQQLEPTGRQHGCRKLKYSTLGAVLQSFGVDLSRVDLPPSAGELYTSPAAAAALGAPNYVLRQREQTEVTTAAATKLFDIFLRAAPEIIAAMPSLERCKLEGRPTAMFDDVGHCTIDGISCLEGVLAEDSERALCDEIVKRATTRELGRTIAVASILSSAHTCE